MDDNTKIRKATISDANAIQEVLIKGFPDTLLKFTIYDTAAYCGYLESRIEAADHYFWVVEYKQKVEGFIHLRLIDRMLFLNNIYLNSELQGQKIGFKLLEIAFSSIDQKAYSEFALDVFSFNDRAKYWYEKLGLKVQSQSFWQKYTPEKYTEACEEISGLENIKYNGFQNVTINHKDRELTIGLIKGEMLRVYDSDLLYTNTLDSILNKYGFECVYIGPKKIESLSVLAVSERMNVDAESITLFN